MPDSLRDRLQATLGAAYTLERELGGGGMSRVFLAEDAALGRRVVVKVLAPDLAEGLSAERFAREVRLAARLQHPNIVPVLAAGTLGRTGAGAAAELPYYTMPFIAGASLRDRLAEGPLPLGEALTVLKDVLRALACAHAAGVVHRDVKPENVLLTGGAAVVADFGIAKALSAAGGGGATLTQVGMAVGTPAYMAPEQAAGEADVDHRADLYAWGLLAWEALAGRHPFAGKTGALALIGAHLTETPAPLASVRGDVPPALAALIARCLAKEPVARPADAGEVLRALDGVELTPRAPRPAARPAASPGRAGAGGETPPSVAVLPFTNASADPEAEYFSDGISEDILGALAKLSGLRVMARTSSFAFKGKNLDVRAIGEQLGARYVLEGSVRRAGDRLRVTAQLLDAAEGHHLWAERYDRDLGDVFAVQDEITAAIRDALSERLLGIGPVRAPAPPAIDAATYELFLRGRRLVERLESADRGVALMEQVIRRAPGFAPAYAELATAHMFRVFYGFCAPRDGWPLVRTLGERAAAIDPACAQAQLVLAEAAFFWEWDWAKAGPLYQRALALDPNDADALATYGMYLASTRRFDEAVRLSAQALALDPLNPIQLVRGMICPYLARRFDDALAVCDRAIALLPEFPESYRWQGLALLAGGRADDAVAALATAARVSGRNVWAVFDLGLALAAAGRADEARALAAEIEAHATHEPVPAYTRTLGAQCALPPDLAGVFRLLDAWVAERGFWLVMLAVEPTFDWLRGDPRFEALVARVGIPGAGRVPPPADDRSLVVLPFANLSPDADTGYFSVGLADELIADLSRVKALRVISRATAMALKNTAGNIPAICRQLGVRYALSGSVRRAGASLRVTVQLVDAATDAPVWADKYAGTLDDVFDVQERLSREITGALAVALTPEESARLARRPFDDVRVFECYLRARDELWHFAPTALDRMRDLIARGRALGGDHPRLLGLEGQLLVQLHNFGVDTDPARLAEAEAIAGRLLGADDTRADGHAVRASVRWRQHRLRDAVRHAREAFALDATQTGAGFLAGALAVNYGDLTGARRDHAALAAVDPWGPMTSLVEASIAWHAGDGVAAVVAMEQATGRWPDDGFMPWFRALALSYAGRAAESAALMDRIAAGSRGTWVEHSARAYACALRGDADGVRRWTAPAWYRDVIALDEMKPLPIAEAYAQVGDADRALELLAVAVRNGLTDEAFLARHNPMLAPLRGDPRFERLLEACRASNAG